MQKEWYDINTLYLFRTGYTYTQHNITCKSINDIIQWVEPFYTLVNVTGH